VTLCQIALDTWLYRAELFHAKEGERSIVMNVSVYVSVCPGTYPWNYTSSLHQFSEHVAFSHGSDLLQRHCDMVCASGFMDDVMFEHIEHSRTTSTLDRV